MRKLGAQCFFVEHPGRSQEEDQDDDAIAIRCQCNHKDLRPKTQRLSFFRTEIISRKDLANLTDDDFLGYCIVRSVALPKEERPRIWVYEAVARWVPLLNNYLHCCSVFDARVGDHEFRVKGAFFAQQNGLTYVCFQSALRMALVHMKEAMGRAIAYPEINDALGIDHKSSAVGAYGDHRAGGVRKDAIDGILRALSPLITPFPLALDPAETQPSAASLIYPFVESGSPAMLFFKGGGATEGHVITVVGHTCNSDSWVPLAEKGYGVPTLPIYSSASWADHLLVQDDNYGMYMCLARDCLCRWRRAATCAPPGAEVPGTPLEPEFQPVHAVGFLPVRAVRSPLNAELVSALLLQQAFEFFLPDSTPWQKRLREAFTDADEPPVLRTFLATKEAYLHHLQIIRDWEGSAVEEGFVKAARNELPQHFWVTEISLRDLYSGNRRKLGEMLSDAAIDNPVDPNEWGQSWLALRLPGIGIVRTTDKKDSQVFELGLLGHTDLFRLECPKPPEW